MSTATEPAVQISAKTSGSGLSGLVRVETKHLQELSALGRVGRVTGDCPHGLAFLYVAEDSLLRANLREPTSFGGGTCTAFPGHLAPSSGSAPTAVNPSCDGAQHLRYAMDSPVPRRAADFAHTFPLREDVEEGLFTTDVP